MKKLSHNQEIRVEGFRYASKIQVITLRGCFEKDGYGNGKTWEEYEARERANAKASYTEFKSAWTYQGPAVLTSDYPGKDAALDKAAKERAEAPLISKGELVEIEGEIYEVAIIGVRYSDPVKFIKVPVNA